MKLGGERAPFVAALVVSLALAVVAGVLLYAKVRPCWPWQQEGSYADGTTCDGHPARFQRN